MISVRAVPTFRFWPPAGDTLFIRMFGMMSWDIRQTRTDLQIWDLYNERSDRLLFKIFSPRGRIEKPFVVAPRNAEFVIHKSSDMVNAALRVRREYLYFQHFKVAFNQKGRSYNWNIFISYLQTKFINRGFFVNL